jgi:hypothetical protein
MKGQYSPVPKTGQTATYGPRDDGALQKGVAWPTPRFIDNNNGTVTDKLTGLIWMKNANAFEVRTWTQALGDANALASGSAGLTDGSKAGDWRLPNVRELQSLIDYGRTNPALPENHPFTGAQMYTYWSSTTRANDPETIAWNVNFTDGYVVGALKTGYNFVICVRNGP